MRITDEQLENWFTYHSPAEIATSQGRAPEMIQGDFVDIRTAGQELARSIRDNCPEGPDTTYAIRLVRMAVMTANQSIACGGK